MATVDDLELTDEVAPPREPQGHYEIIGDEIREKPPMGVYETILGSIIQELMGPFARSRGLGQVVTETLFDLRPAVDRSRRPDLAFISAEKWPPSRRVRRRMAAWAIVPDLCIEIVSPSNSNDDVFGKLEEYFLAGSLRVLIVLPEHRKVYDYSSPTSVRILAEPDAIEGGDILPGFRLPLLDLFGDEADDRESVP